jgi:tellurite resistance protein
MGKISGHLRFTVEERILLHLLNFTSFRDKIEVPQAITQQGISQCIRVKRKHLPRSLKSMIEKTLLMERTTHVKDKTQRMKTYYLTMNGEAKANELKEGIMDLTIRIKDKDGQIKEKTISEVEKLVEGLYNLAEVLSDIISEGIFHLQEPQEEKEEDKEQTTISKIKVYRKALVQAWKDGKMTSDERELLRNLRVSLGISEQNHVKLEEEILKNAVNTSDAEAVEVYKVALKQALADNKITPDERAILEKIKKNFHIKDL